MQHLRAVQHISAAVCDSSVVYVRIETPRNHIRPRNTEESHTAVQHLRAVQRAVVVSARSGLPMLSTASGPRNGSGPHLVNPHLDVGTAHVEDAAQRSAVGGRDASCTRGLHKSVSEALRRVDLLVRIRAD
eukprot:SAG11_NODE_2033_length_3899_cov_2.298421_4_plen_131_part_00